MLLCLNTDCYVPVVERTRALVLMTGTRLLSFFCHWQVLAAYMRMFPAVFAALTASSAASSYKPLTPDAVGGVVVLEKVYKWIAQV